ncbi:hypothetical protein HRR83_001171 [Exophiala dermatitidis]|uniref:Uncharacterized protein n=1 Tax=Exophiala dermatitidis TaxID=5970 RepID=A0AAN6IY82_EXODE|nr:hypothetical protein HRR74_001175 [Exophiala dermatitidis]KAJ4546698.1 hypothetical protein HRR77_004244 [Exophiala dermatitidis]KAJ4583807.1 hypothetical protein HRR82_003148 [Exophiala dermatitidis]KAJ4599560.1 hypothetical protein HRR84_003311 [Exophiala dermatitidis]KAJ4605209.1 hypothetical protein HRR83_001171 [Exophiala dermatitidis]
MKLALAHPAHALVSLCVHASTGQQDILALAPVTSAAQGLKDEVSRPRIAPEMMDHKETHDDIKSGACVCSVDDDPKDSTRHTIHISPSHSLIPFIFIRDTPSHHFLAAGEGLHLNLNLLYLKLLHISSSQLSSPS